MTSHSDEECPCCGAGGFNGGYCWDCGYDADQIDPDGELIDQIEFEDESEWLDLFSDENIGR